MNVAMPESSTRVQMLSKYFGKMKCGEEQKGSGRLHMEFGRISEDLDRGSAHSPDIPVYCRPGRARDTRSHSRVSQQLLAGRAKRMMG